MIECISTAQLLVFPNNLKSFGPDSLTTAMFPCLWISEEEKTKVVIDVQFIMALVIQTLLMSLLLFKVSPSVSFIWEFIFPLSLAFTYCTFLFFYWCFLLHYVIVQWYEVLYISLKSQAQCLKQMVVHSSKMSKISHKTSKIFFSWRSGSFPLVREWGGCGAQSSSLSIAQNVMHQHILKMAASSTTGTLFCYFKRGTEDEENSDAGDSQPAGVKKARVETSNQLGKRILCFNLFLSYSQRNSLPVVFIIWL